MEPIRIEPPRRRPRIIFCLIALTLAVLLLAAGVLWHLRNRAWADEVNFLRESIFDTHLLFDDKMIYMWQLPEEIAASRDDVHQRVNAEADALIKRIPWMRERDIILNLPRLVAALGDLHSNLDDAYWQYDVTPFFFAYMTDGYYFYAYHDGGFSAREQEVALLGSKLVAVNGHDLAAVLEGAAQILASENPYGTRAGLYNPLMNPAILYAIGLHSDPESAPEYTFEAPDGLVTLTPSGMISLPDGVFFQDLTAIIYAKDDPTTRIDHPTDEYELFYLEKDTVLHIRCRAFSGPKIDKLAPDVEAALRINPQLETIIVDMRGNPGGYGRYSYGMLEAIRDGRPDLCQSGRIYVITDGGSLSAAVEMTFYLKTQCNATLVGEPTGQGVWFFAGASPLTLPKSGLAVYLSEYHSLFRVSGIAPIDPQRIYREADAIYPDVLIERTIEEYMADIDPVLEWILAQPLKDE